MYMTIKYELISPKLQVKLHFIKKKTPKTFIMVKKKSSRHDLIGPVALAQ